MLVLTEAEIRELLDLDVLVEAVAGAMADASAGRVSMPSRIAALVPERNGLLAAMPAYLPSAGALTVKLVSLFPQNASIGIPTHQAVIVAFDPETGTPLAIMDGTYITATRTAAGSALATRLLARPEAAVLAVLGTGVQARTHARAIPRVRKLREIRIAGRNAAAVERLAQELRGELGFEVRACKSYAEALDGADIVAATSHAVEPVVRREWLAPGTHVNSVGFNHEGREVDGATVRDALVVVETRASALAPYPSGANDLLWAIRDGLIGADHVHAELGELVSGVRPGRTSRDQITLYKSVGVAVQDAAAAALVLRAAKARVAGREIAL
ncbi:MAG TPA: ornithine cyclodeaminase family protein [Methylomirabilota bacterium]|nr:ornithine cyclodeaminase family protein [Methylomirabilota bacterium]